MMQTWRVWLLDVWGDSEEWNVNDRLELGIIDFDDDGTEDQAILDLLQSLGLGRKIANVDVAVEFSSPNNVTVDWCREPTEKEHFSKGHPWLQLEAKEARKARDFAKRYRVELGLEGGKR